MKFLFLNTLTRNLLVTIVVTNCYGPAIFQQNLIKVVGSKVIWQIQFYVPQHGFRRTRKFKIVRFFSKSMGDNNRRPIKCTPKFVQIVQEITKMAYNDHVLHMAVRDCYIGIPNANWLCAARPVSTLSLVIISQAKKSIKITYVNRCVKCSNWTKFDSSNLKNGLSDDQNEKISNWVIKCIFNKLLWCCFSKAYKV